MFDKKKVNLNQINKVMKSKTKQEREVKERNINNFIKKEHERSLTSPITNSHKRPNRISWK